MVDNVENLVYLLSLSLFLTPAGQVFCHFVHERNPDMYVCTDYCISYKAQSSSEVIFFLVQGDLCQLSLLKLLVFSTENCKNSN